MDTQSEAKGVQNSRTQRHECCSQFPSALNADRDYRLVRRRIRPSPPNRSRTCALSHTSRAGGDGEEWCPPLQTTPPWPLRRRQLTVAVIRRTSESVPGLSPLSAPRCWRAAHFSHFVQSGRNLSCGELPLAIAPRQL
jgi:hypothetical protein